MSTTSTPTQVPVFDWGTVWGNNILWAFIIGGIIAAVILVIFFLTKKDD